MNVYPIRVPRSPYRGNAADGKRKAERYNADAQAVETYLNDKIRADPRPTQRYAYGNIAADLSMTIARVRELLNYSVGSHNALDVAKTAEDARRARDIESGRG